MIVQICVAFSLAPVTQLGRPSVNCAGFGLNHMFSRLQPCKECEINYIFLIVSQ